jgi:hypothetical protein
VITGTDATGLGDGKSVLRFPKSPDTAYSTAIEKDFEHSSPDAQHDFLESLAGSDAVHIQASAQIATSISRTPDGHLNCFFANFAGLQGGVNPVQTPQENVQVAIAAKTDGKGFFLPFLGEAQAVKGVRDGETVRFTLPAISKGAVFWYEP